MTTELPAPAHDRILRECDCPPWVERCAHYGDLAIILSTSGQDSTHHPTCSLLNAPDDTAYVAPVSALVACPECGHERAGIYRGSELFRSFDDDQARAAFHEAEERLLRGEQL